MSRPCGSRNGLGSNAQPDGIYHNEPIAIFRSDQPASYQPPPPPPPPPPPDDPPPPEPLLEPGAVDAELTVLDKR